MVYAIKGLFDFAGIKCNGRQYRIMSEKFIILRRLPSNVTIFGGEVYIDIDGKNVGILGENDFSMQLETGMHTLRMYKSHKMSSFIGEAEVKFNMVEGMPLFARYSAPLMINQSGTIIVSDYKSKEQLDELLLTIEKKLTNDYQREEATKNQKEYESKKNERLLFWIILIPIIIWVLWYISWSIQLSSLF